MYVFIFTPRLSGVHPYQQADDEKMLIMIEKGQWPGWKPAQTWAKVFLF
jgi:hypothetical protein